MREMYFRSTGKFPRTTQMITLLLSLDNPDNLLMEINTGEGKSITTAMLAALQWAKAKGDTVNVCTANMSLVDQDYTEKGAGNFFDCMGIPSTIVRSDSPKGTYKVGGINYSNVANLSLYRSRANLEGELLTSTIDGRETATHLILDESDYVTLEDKTLFNLAMGIESDVDIENNPFAWVYPLINEFVDKKKFRNIYPNIGDVWTRLRDIKELKIFLDKHAETVENKKLLASLDDKKFEKWLTAACVAKGRVSGTHYIVQEENRKINGENKKVHIVVPLINTVPQTGSIFSNSEQQFLQARLQKGDKSGALFPIDPEMLFVASESAKNFIDAHRERGRIIGISGTVGVLHELMEQQAKYGLEAISIPPHEINKRQKLETRVTKSSVAQVKEIKKHYNSLIKTNKNETQPVLMICKDINQARDLYNKLGYPTAGKIKDKELQIITGEESEAELKKKIKKAADPNVFTISTSLLGRGTDIEPKHKDGLFVIQAYLDTKRNTRQIIGRAARNGKVGQYVAIYDANGIPHQQQFGSLMKMSSAERKKTLKKIQALMNQEAAVERHFIQEAAMIQQVAMKQFDNWQGFLDLLYSESERKELKKSLLVMREGLITQLTEQWTLRLEESDAMKAYPNPYIRRDRQGKLITKEINDALKSFEEDAAKIWAVTRAKLSEKTNNKLTHPINQLRAGYMLQIDFSEQLKVNKINARKERKAASKEQEIASRRIKSGLDMDAAVLRFGGTAAVLEDMKQRSVWKQLNFIAQYYNDVIKKTSLKGKLNLPALVGDTAQDSKTLVKKFAEFANVFEEFQKNNSLSEKNRMQPVVIEFLAVYSQYSHLLSPVDQELPQKIIQLKTDYIDNAANELANNLKSMLSWANEKGFDYFIERTAVKEAAVAILNAANALTKPVQKEQIKSLYSVLQKHQVNLKNLWIPSFGHANTLELIKNTLSTFNDLARISDFPSNFRQECQEDALVEIHGEDFISEINKKFPNNSNPKWKSIKEEIQEIYKNNKSFYVFSEIEARLTRYKSELSFHDPLLKSLQELIYKIRQKTDQVSEQYPQLMDESRYLLDKAENIQTTLTDKGINVDHVSLKHGHTGFNDYFELVVEGAGNDEVFVDFTRYNTQLDNYENQYETKSAEVKTLQINLKVVHSYIENFKNYTDSHQFPVEGLPESFKERVTKINSHINLLKSNDFLYDNPSFSSEVNEQIKSRSWISKLTEEYPQDIENCTDIESKEEIAEYFKNLSSNKNAVTTLEKEKNVLKTELEEAEKAKNERELMKGTTGRVYTFFNSVREMFGKKTVESIRAELKENKEKLDVAEKKVNLSNIKEIQISRLETQARAKLQKQIDTETASLHEQLIEYRETMAQSIELLKPEIDYLNKIILEEKEKGSVMMQRFEHLDELLKYEVKLKAVAEREDISVEVSSLEESDNSTDKITEIEPVHLEPSINQL